MILQVVMVPTATGPNNLEANYGTSQELDTFFQSVNQRNDDLAFERIINVPKRSIGDSSLKQLHDWARKNKK